MQEKTADMATKNPKKANLLDHHSIKHLLDESVTEVKTMHLRIRLCSDSLIYEEVFDTDVCFCS